MMESRRELAGCGLCHVPRAAGLRSTGLPPPPPPPPRLLAIFAGECRCHPPSPPPDVGLPPLALLMLDCSCLPPSYPCGGASPRPHGARYTRAAAQRSSGQGGRGRGVVMVSASSSAAPAVAAISRSAVYV